jgi:hypothetical protein
MDNASNKLLLVFPINHKIQETLHTYQKEQQRFKEVVGEV